MASGVRRAPNRTTPTRLHEVWPESGSAPRCLVARCPTVRKRRVGGAEHTATFRLTDLQVQSLPPEELVAVIHIAARGDALVDPSVARRLVARFTARLAPTETHSHATQLDSLTPREKEVFVLVATGYSNTEIASQVYIGDETVKTHVSRILSKLGLRDRVHAVVYAHHHGLVT